MAVLNKLIGAVHLFHLLCCFLALMQGFWYIPGQVYQVLCMGGQVDQLHNGCTGGQDQMVDQVQVELSHILSYMNMLANLGVNHIFLCNHVCDAGKRTVCQHCFLCPIISGQDMITDYNCHQVNRTVQHD